MFNLFMIRTCFRAWGAIKYSLYIKELGLPGWLIAGLVSKCAGSVFCSDFSSSGCYNAQIHGTDFQGECFQVKALLVRSAAARENKTTGQGCPC